MPYDPEALDETQRSWAYGVMWVGLAANIVALVAYLAAGLSLLSAIAGALVTVALITAVRSRKIDDYFVAICETGKSWTLALVTAALFAFVLLRLGDAGYAVGYYAGSDGEIGTRVSRLPVFVNDAYLLALLSSLAFLSGVAFARLRDRFGA